MKTSEAIKQLNKIISMDPLKIQNGVILDVIQDMHKAGVYVPMQFNTNVSTSGVSSNGTYWNRTPSDYMYEKILSLPQTSPAYEITVHTVFERREVVDGIIFDVSAKIITELKNEDEEFLRKMGVIRDEYQTGYMSTRVMCNI